MKTGKLAIQPWLVCQYNKNMLADLPSSVAQQKKFLVSKFEPKTKECKNRTAYIDSFLLASLCTKKGNFFDHQRSENL